MEILRKGKGVAMKNMTEKEKMEKIREVLEKNKALTHAITILHWDLETEAPKDSVERISKTLGYLTGENYSMIINDEFKNLVYSINVEELDEVDKKIIKELKKEYFEKLEKIPKEDYMKYSELTVVSTKKWEEAKNKDDFDIFKTYLSEVIEYNKKFIKYRGYEENPYNTLLDDYEPYCERIGRIFQQYKKRVVSFY